MPIGTSKIGVLGAGTVPGGTQTFNASGTFSVPPGVTRVNITGRGGSGNSGNLGNSGNPGNPGTGAGGGGGGGPPVLQGSSWINGPATPGGHAFRNSPFVQAFCPSNYSVGGNSGNAGCAFCGPAIGNTGATGTSGISGNAGTGGTGGNPGNAGNSSSGLNYTFPAGNGGNAGNAGAAGNGGTAGNGGNGGGGGAYCSSYTGGAGGTGGTGGGSGGAGRPRNGPQVPTNSPPYSPNCLSVKFRGGQGGGGAGASNPGQNGANGTWYRDVNHNKNVVAYGGTISNASAPAPNSPTFCGIPIPTNTIGGIGFNFTQAPTISYFTGNVPQVNRQDFNSFSGNCIPDVLRAGAAGGTGGGATYNRCCGGPLCSYQPYFNTAGGGGGGGRGNAKNAGGASTAGSGNAGTPATYNCVPVTPGSPYPIVVGGPTGGQVVISWNPQ